MGSSSSTTTSSQQSQNGFGTATAPTVQSIINQLNPLIANSGTTAAENGAISQLTANGQAGNPYAPAIGNAATTLLNGGNATAEVPGLRQNLSTLNGTLAPYVDPNYSTITSAPVQAALQQVKDDVTNQVNGQFAAAGRAGSGMNTQTLARGIAQGEAPIILNQANTDTANRMAAANTLFGAGNTTANAITGMNQQGVANSQAGISAANDALTANNWGPQSVIAAQELAKSIPSQNLGVLAQLGIPLAGLNMTRSGTGTQDTTYNPSLLSDITQLGGLFSSGAGGTSAAAGLGQAAAGAGSGILGLLSLL
ncbi:tail fiber domain-containing protein [Bradyrhizobium sp. Pear77]|uniref:tail fiber domain-containing protein n=1 Tax=Bradyrhizobium altum TaxID=1571202 RepID=UPI001E2B61B7|nr:tail fiber domain-containing protein [Bradyrhizobium altum]MCC8954103.1 tail fiber domain-containing protein [Bradyrhizobium altum]